MCVCVSVDFLQIFHDFPFINGIAGLTASSNCSIPSRVGPSLARPACSVAAWRRPGWAGPPGVQSGCNAGVNFTKQNGDDGDINQLKYTKII